MKGSGSTVVIEKTEKTFEKKFGIKKTLRILHMVDYQN